MFYKVPIDGAHWGAAELRHVAASLCGVGDDHGAAVQELRTEIQKYYEGDVLLLNSGRAALEIALRDIAAHGSSDAREVLVPSLICSTVPAKIALCGFKPVFFDVGDDMAPSVARALAAARPTLAAVLFPHIYGKAVDLAELTTWCRTHRVPLIEDCAATFLLNGPSGALSGADGDYVVFSYQVGKTVVAGGGGALISRCGRPLDTALLPWSAGEEKAFRSGKVSFVLEYVAHRTGYAYWKVRQKYPRNFSRDMMEQVRPMSRLEAQLILVQMRKWAAVRERKIAVLERYRQNLSGGNLRLPQYRPGEYVGRVFVEFPQPILARGEHGAKSSPVLDFLKQRAVQVQLPYLPAHWREQYRQDGAHLANSERFATSCIEVPSQPSLRASEIDYVCECLREAAKLIA